LPKGYIDVKSAQDVRAAILCAKKFNIPLVAKSGGHSFEGYSFGNDNNHWVLDLRSLNKIEIDKLQSIGTIGPGNRNYDLSIHLWNNGKFAMDNGRTPSVGIGGLALGGGFGSISRKYGIAADTILEMEVVTADGKILVANNTTNEDLFWALCGAGIGNFGVVTQFKFKLFQLSYTIASVNKTYSIDCFPIIFDQWQKWIASNPDPSISVSTISIIELRNNLNDLGKFVLFIVIVEENSAKRLQLIDEVRSTFPSITEEDIHLHYFDEVNENNAKTFPSVPFPVYVRSKSYYVKHVIDKASINRLYSAIMRAPPLVSVINFDAYGGAINARAPDANAFIHRENLYNFEIGVASVTLLDLVVHDVMLDSFISQTKFLFSNESYQNYISAQLENWQNYYYGQNLGRLIQIKNKYDPNNFFKYKQSIPLN
jgi:hypothetical protein